MSHIKKYDWILPKDTSVKIYFNGYMGINQFIYQFIESRTEHDVGVYEHDIRRGNFASRETCYILFSDFVTFIDPNHLIKL